MNLNHRLKIFATILFSGILFSHVCAHNLSEVNEKIVVSNSENWVTVQNVNGIKILFSEIEKEGKTYLKIQFQNTTNEEIQFSWSLNKSARTVINESNSIIKALGSVDIDNNLLIPFNNGDTYADFSFNINLIK
ncbi:MAG: hypothetical protein M3Q58_08930 [Bacteroidota bacterium]|nr:hypothetical protein [Bacteroidota bacterium]